jgi:ABC-type multidrug transport system fused ATPase/permease subunit
VTSETFNNLKVLKLYAWEDEFLRRIEEMRDKELYYYGIELKMENLNRPLTFTSNVLFSVVSIGVYSYVNGDINVSNILACIYVFVLLQNPLDGLPWFIATYI